MAILSRVKISPQQRYDLEDLFAQQAAHRADSKLWTQKFLSESNLIMGGFSVTGVGLNSATVAMTGCSLIIPQNTFDFSYFVSAPVEPDVVIPDADLVDGARNYLEIELATQDGTPLTKAFWDPEANSDNGAEFNQIVNTITDLKLNFVVSTGGFSGSPDRLPVAIIDTDISGTIKVILDRRELFGRLAKPNDLDNEYAWGVKVEPVYNLNMTGVVGIFLPGEPLTIGGETATCVAGGGASITFNEPTGINFGNGDTVTGGDSGATGTVNTIAESFVGVDKNLKGQKMVNDALMTEIKALKGTRFWWQTGPTLVGLKTEAASLIAPITGGAKVKWDGSNVIITDDSLTPSDADQVAAVRLLASIADLMLTRQDDGKEVITITFNEVADEGTIVLDQDGNLISIDWDDNTAAIQAAWDGSGAFAATIAGSVAAKKITITANAAGAEVDVIEDSNTLENAGDPVVATITIKQGMASDGSIPLADGEFLYIDLPNPLANTVYDGVGIGAANFKVAARGDLSITDQSYWLAYREGTKLVWRFAGELQPGESSQISDNVPQGILDAIGIVSETSMPSYGSDIRGSAQESLVDRASALTDAVGDEQEDRSGYLRSDDVVTWTGTQLEFTTDIVLEFINTKDGSVRQHVIDSSESPLVLADGESIYALIDREAASPQALTPINSGVTPIPAQSQAQKDVFVLFRRNDALGNPFLHIPFHKQVLEAGQSVSLGASGSGGGGGDSLAGDYKRRLVLSPFQFVTPVVFETVKDTLTDPASTGEFSPAKKAFEVDLGETFVSDQMLDADFLDDGVDVAEIELWLNWLDGFVDTAATYEVSRNGGLEWQTIPMTRIGLSGSYRGYFTFEDEASNEDLQGYAVGNADTTNVLDATTGQSRAQGFVVTSQEVIKQVELYLNKIGSPTGTYRAKIVADDSGAPSTSVSDILAESDAQQISSLSAGNNAVLVTMPTTVLPAGSYWLVIETDATYKGVFSAGVTQIAVRADGSAPSTSDSETFDGSIWSTVAGNALTYQFKGRLHDLRVRITSSAADKFISGFGVFYGIYDGVTASGEKLVQRFAFSGDENRTVFTLDWTPDPDLLQIYDPYRGQVYVVADGVCRISGNTISFEADTFDFPGESVFLIFRQNVGTSFDNSDQNAAAISEIQDNLVDIGDELASISDSMILPKIVAPNTVIQGRALIPDFTQDLSPRFGRSRLMTQELFEIQNEQGPNGEQVFGVLNDLFGQVRCVGNWTSTGDVTGANVKCLGNLTDFIEVSFYGTGINVLTTFHSTGADMRAAIDGGAEGANIFTGSATASTVLANRSYASDQVIKVVSGLTPGMHTVRIRNNQAGFFQYIYGFEILNENASGLIQIMPGSQLHKGKKRTLSAINSVAYNSSFESGVLGARGGRVLMYQKLDGSVAKAVTPTDAAAAYLTLANHGNEEAIDFFYHREFGFGRTDDFSTIEGATVSRAYQLDDNLTSLVGNSVFVDATNEWSATSSSSTGFYHSFTFHGTGCDILRQDAGATINQHEVFVDGVSVGNLSSVGSTLRRYEKICSGLPMGTHVVRIQRQVSGGNNVGILGFKTYAPRKPTLPANAVEIGEYLINATFVANATAALDRVSTGVTRTHSTRGFMYSGTWSLTQDVTNYIGGWEATTTTNGGWAEKPIYGQGFELRFRADTNRSATIAVTINGLAATTANFPSMVSSVYGTGVVFNSGTGNLDQNDGATSNGSGLIISGLPLGNYVVRFTNGTTNVLSIQALDEITPIYMPRNAGPQVTQNARKMGSQGIVDLRKFSGKDVVMRQSSFVKTRGVTAGITMASGSIKVLEQCGSAFEVKKAGWFKIAGGSQVEPGSTNTILMTIWVNGVQQGDNMGGQTGAANYNFPVINSQRIYLMPGVYFAMVKGLAGGGPVAGSSTRRYLQIEELKE